MRAVEEEKRGKNGNKRKRNMRVVEEEKRGKWEERK